MARGTEQVCRMATGKGSSRARCAHPLRFRKSFIYAHAQLAMINISHKHFTVQHRNQLTGSPSKTVACIISFVQVKTRKLQLKTRLKPQ